MVDGQARMSGRKETLVHITELQHVMRREQKIPLPPGKLKSRFHFAVAATGSHLSM